MPVGAPRVVGGAGVASRWKEVGPHSAAVSPSPHSLEVIKFHSNLFSECLASPSLWPSQPLRHHLPPSPIAGYRHTHTQPPRRPKNRRLLATRTKPSETTPSPITKSGLAEPRYSLQPIRYPHQLKNLAAPPNPRESTLQSPLSPPR